MRVAVRSRSRDVEGACEVPRPAHPPAQARDDDSGWPWLFVLVHATSRARARSLAPHTHPPKLGMTIRNLRAKEPPRPRGPEARGPSHPARPPASNEPPSNIPVILTTEGRKDLQLR